ncbi:ribosomal RNA small subunit methyltransferase G [Bacilli bacterium]|nr:ribosomal RNA small subunit methyltransferase G [Bacilli bacterium]
MNVVEFKKQITLLFKNINSSFFSNIEKYKTFLQDYNKKINLTRLDAEDKIYGEYFYESIYPYREIDFSKIKNVLDIGSGSGIPGVIIKLLFLDIDLTIIESNNKKCNFLRELCKYLNINVIILNQRAEELNDIQREKYNLVTSRAVAPLKTILEVSIPYATVNGIILEQKSNNIENEFIGVEELLKDLDCTYTIKNSISFTEHTHNIVIVKKHSKTPMNYPRL